MEKAIRKKRRLWARFRTFGGHKKYMDYLAARRKADDKRKAARRGYEERLAVRAKTNPKAYYNYIQSKSSLRGAVGDIVNDAGEPAADDQEKADRLVSFFESVHRQDSGHSSQLTSCESNHTPAMQDIRITVDETLKYLLKTNINKAAGPDGVHPAIIKPVAPVIAPHVARLFQESLTEGVLPNDWKMASVTPIHKGGRKEDANNYRPVSLTPVLLKTMERIVRDKMVEHVVKYNIISARQHGFMRRRGCQSNLLCFLNEITGRLDKGEEVEVCYFDFKKAFDSVNQRLLMIKLKGIGVPPTLLAWTNDFLCHRKFCVKVGDKESRLAVPTSGVPQGSVLGPLLFLIFVNDLVKSLVSPGYMFADDLKIIGNPSANQVQEDLDRVYRWTIEWDLPLNCTKCKRLGTYASTGPSRTLGSGDLVMDIPDTDVMKDLGVTMTRDFQPRMQCENAVRKTNGALYQLGRAVKSRRPEVMVPLYKIFVRPHLEYCVQAWGPYLKKDIASLERPQRRFTRWFRELRHLPYEQRLEKLNLFSMARRRRRGDLIETFKILKGFTDIPKDALLELAPPSSLRGHELKLVKPRSKKNARAKFFSHRVVTDWNSLPQEAIQVQSVDAFKHKLDACWEEIFPDAK
ncbi:MAG: reverse transcriptase family protein [Candidatus Thiodiazotropha sp.]